MGPDDISRFHQILEVFSFVTYQVKYICIVVVNPLIEKEKSLNPLYFVVWQLYRQG
jgi:hypothetical protein